MDFRKLENSIDKKRIILDSKTIKDYYLANTLNRDVSIPAVIQVLYKKVTLSFGILQDQLFCVSNYRLLTL